MLVHLLQQRGVDDADRQLRHHHQQLIEGRLLALPFVLRCEVDCRVELDSAIHPFAVRRHDTEERVGVAEASRGTLPRSSSAFATPCWLLDSEAIIPHHPGKSTLDAFLYEPSIPGALDVDCLGDRAAFDALQRCKVAGVVCRVSFDASLLVVVLYPVELATEDDCERLQWEVTCHSVRAFRPPPFRCWDSDAGQP